MHELSSLVMMSLKYFSSGSGEDIGSNERTKVSTSGGGVQREFSDLNLGSKMERRN